MNVAFGTDNSATTRILSPLVFMCELISMYLATKVGYFAWKNDKPSTGNANNLQNHVQKCAMMASQSVARYCLLETLFIEVSILKIIYVWQFFLRRLCQYRYW